MPEQNHPAATYDPGRLTKRDLIILVTGFGEFRGIVDNPASAVATRLDGELRSVTNDWGNTVHLRIVGVGNVPAVFQDENNEHLGPSKKDDDVHNYVAQIHDGAAGNTQKVSGPQFVAAQIEMTHPDVVISLGVDPQESMIRVEREVHNLVRMDYGRNTNNHEHPTMATRLDFVDAARPRAEQKVEAYLHDGDAFEILQTRLPIARILDAIGRKGMPCHDASNVGTFVTGSVMREVIQEIDHPRNGAHILRGGFIHLPLATNQRPVQKMVECIIEACMETAKVIPESEWC